LEKGKKQRGIAPTEEKRTSLEVEKDGIRRYQGVKKRESGSVGKTEFQEQKTQGGDNYLRRGGEWEKSQGKGGGSPSYEMRKDYYSRYKGGTRRGSRKKS